MGLTVSDVIERTINEHLHSGGANIPQWTTLTNNLDTTTKTFAVGTRISVPPDSVLEFLDPSMEMALNNITSGSTVEVHERGYLETTAASHLAGTRIVVNNPWPRIVLFNTLKGLISSLYAYGLYRRTLDTSRTLSTVAPVALNALDRDVATTIRYRSGTSWYRLHKGDDFEVIHEASPIEIQFYGGMQGATLRLVTKRDFTAPTALTDDLDTLGIPTSLQQFMSLGLASMVLQGKEVPEVQAEHIRRSLANQDRPVGSRISVSNALWQAFMRQVALERTRQMEANPPAIVNS